ncbi:MAG: hypothetical protein FJ207_09480 [Gemmatimonadetes bacterium]|nr:hypothetical protein [Gemmatimonadota bacterium]
MKLWLGIVVGAAAAVALTLLPPDALEIRRREALPEQARWAQLSSELGRAYGELYATRWSAWLSEQAAQAEPGAFLFGAPASEDASEENVAAWERSYLDLIETLEPRDPSVRLGVFWQPVGRAEQESAVFGEPAVFAGTHDGATYCFLIVPYRDEPDLQGVLSRHGLGPCAFYARYGAPGTAIAAWLEAGAWGFASQRSPIADYRQIMGNPANEPLLMFGTRRQSPIGFTFASQGCMAGDPAKCETAVTDPAQIGASDADDAYVVATTPLSYVIDQGPSQPPFAYLDDTLLADAEREFGADAFARFWSSDAPVTDAFAAAFGVDLGEWVTGWLQDRTGVYMAGPRVGGADLMLTLMALTVITALGTAVAVRRQV